MHLLPFPHVHCVHIQGTPENKLGDDLALQLIHLVIGAFLASLEHMGIDKAHWALLAGFMRRWAHRGPVISAWHGEWVRGMY